MEANVSVDVIHQWICLDELYKLMKGLVLELVFELLAISLRRLGDVLEGRGGELQTPHFVPEGILSSKSMFDNFSNHIEQENKNCYGILNEMQNLIIFQVL